MEVIIKEKTREIVGSLVLDILAGDCYIEGLFKLFNLVKEYRKGQWALSFHLHIAMIKLVRKEIENKESAGCILGSIFRSFSLLMI